MKTDKHPFAVNIRKLQRYNFEFFTTEEAVFFEYIIVKTIYNGGGEYYHSSQEIRRETGIKRSALNTIIERFKALGILKVEVKGMPNIKYFWVEYRRVIELLPQIFQLNSSYCQQVNQHQLLLDFLIPQMHHNEERRLNREYREWEKEQRKLARRKALEEQDL